MTPGVVHVMSDTSGCEPLDEDEAVCTPDAPWRGDKPAIFVVYHPGTVRLADGRYKCLTCGECEDEGAAN